jgi:hypothetical protein
VGSAKRRLAAEIRRYCEDCPEASDSLDGIAWWLARQRFKEAREDIEEAVEVLLDEGVLERRQLADGSVVFSCRVTRNHREP